MKLLVTGCHGQVGSEVCRLASLGEVEVVATDHDTLDITSCEAVCKAVEFHQPSIVINAAAHTAVDKAESEPERAFAINASGPHFLAQACAEAGIPLVHISTDYVFNGAGDQPYIETDAVSPLGVYGETKYQGEQAVREQLDRYMILRTSWVFGAHGHNFVKTMLRLGAEREQLSVVDDQVGCPTFATDIAKTLLVMAKSAEAGQASWGTYHYCGGAPTTWCQFARAIFEEAAKHTTLAIRTVDAIETKDFPTPAQRPAYSVLCCDKIADQYSVAPSDWRAALAQCVPVILQES